VRALGIDLGSVRVGVAICDSGGLVATPYEVVARSGDPARDRRRILELAEEAGVEVIVVGLPLSMDGSRGPAARAAEDETDALRALTELPVILHDERLTTVSADRTLQAQGLGARERRKVVDKVAAAVMLQAWLDQRRAAPGPGAGDRSGHPEPAPEGTTVGPPRSRRRRTRR
jgi:putative Holliday junction resolvase